MPKTQTAILAGGCFWGMEDLFRKLDGVVDTQVGYTGGKTQSPQYKDVKTGGTGHAEALKIAFDPAKVSYRQLLEFFFQLHDPTTLNRQGNDIGTQYRSAIFFLDRDQEQTALEIVDEINASRVFSKPVTTRIEAAGPWYDAEENHQDYLEKYPEGYTCHFVRPEWRLKAKA
jgi:peptide-methionine (S)-S-oxide reductase